MRAASAWCLFAAVLLPPAGCDDGEVAAPPAAPAFARAVAGPKGKIAFASDRTGNYEVFIMDASTGALTNITNNPASDGPGGMVAGRQADPHHQ